MKRKRKGQPMSPEHLRVVQERRRSHASGLHQKRIDKSAEKRRAISEQE